MTNFILLPTGRPANRKDLILSTWDGAPHLHQADCHSNQVHEGRPAMYLYQTSPLDLVEGELCIHLETGKIHRVYQGGPSLDCVKVVASTDPTLNLPLIPQETIREYIQWYNSQVPA